MVPWGRSIYMAKTRKIDNFIVTALLVACTMLIAGLIGDYYYDLNDDVLIKDILSGSYTGVPEGNNIQMLYPIGAFISLLYRLIRPLPWYGIFLCVLQYGCFAIMIKRTADVLKFSELGFLKKLVVLLFEFSVMLGMFLPHFLFVQYTVTCGLMSTTAAFLILTGHQGDSSPYAIPMWLVLTAFCIRSEMLLLTLPMVLLAILMKWVFICFETTSEKEKKSYLIKYVNLCIGTLAGILVCLAVNKIAYSSPDWREFMALFNNRTELYDFQSIPDYEENKAFYDSIGLSESEQQLLINYNFGLDDRIDSGMLGQIADYAAFVRSNDKSLGERLSEASRLYFYKLCKISAPKGYEYPMTDYPWNLIVLLLYLMAFGSCIVALRNDNRKMLIAMGLLALLFACRTSLWMFILMRGRDPIRITHPLYLMEIFILTGFVLALFGLYRVLVGKDETAVNRTLLGMVMVMTLMGFIGTPFEVKVVKDEMTRRETSLSRYEELEAYMKDNSESYFLLDVYTSVSFATVTGKDEATYSGKMFAGVDNTGYNHDLLGGWASKSPLSVKKIRGLGCNSMEEALLSQGVYLVQNLDTDTDWVTDYYADKGIAVNVRKVKEVEEVFGIYSVTRAEE